MLHLHRFQNQQGFAFAHLLAGRSQHGPDVARHGRTQRPLALAALIWLRQWRKPGELGRHAINLDPIAMMGRGDDNGTEMPPINGKRQVWGVVLKHQERMGCLLIFMLKSTAKAAIFGGRELSSQFLLALCAKAIDQWGVRIVAPVAVLAGSFEIMPQRSRQHG